MVLWRTLTLIDKLGLPSDTQIDRAQVHCHYRKRFHRFQLFLSFLWPPQTQFYEKKFPLLKPDDAISFTEPNIRHHKWKPSNFTCKFGLTASTATHIHHSRSIFCYKLEWTYWKLFIKVHIRTREFAIVYIFVLAAFSTALLVFFFSSVVVLSSIGICVRQKSWIVKSKPHDADQQPTQRSM